MNKKHFSRTAALSAIVFAAGCGGGGSKVHLNLANIEFTGAETVDATSTTATTVPATGGTEVGTSSGTAVIPSGAVTAGSTVPAGSQLAIIPIGTGVTGTFPAGTQLIVNGTANSGAPAGTDGKLDVNVALPVTPGDVGTFYTLSFPGGILPTRVLHVGEFVFSGRFYFKTIGGVPQIVSPVPIALGGALPNDGQNAAGSYMNCQWTANNAGRVAKLTVDYGTGFRLKQTQVIDARGAATFRDLFPDTQNVPPTGVQTVTFEIGDLP